MKEERSQKEQVKAAMAEFAAAYEKGQHEKMASFLAPEARLYLQDAAGIQEIVGAAAASRSLEGLKGHAQARFGEAKIQFKAGGAAWVEAKLEMYEAADAAKYDAHAAKSAQFGAARSAGAKAYEARALEAQAGHAMQAHEAQAKAAGKYAYEAHAGQAQAGHAMQASDAQYEAAGMISAELEKHGEQWLVKQMHYRSE
jgi:hypothetical protein